MILIINVNFEVVKTILNNENNNVIKYFKKIYEKEITSNKSEIKINDFLNVKYGLNTMIQ